MSTENAAEDSVQRIAALLQEARGELAKSPANALLLADRCIQVAEEAMQWRDASGAWRVRGQCLRALGKHRDAINAFTAAATAANTAADPLLAAQSQIGSIDSYTMLGAFNDAAALATTLIDTFKELGSPLDAAKALCNLGSLYLRQDRYSDALNCYTEAEQAFEETEAVSGAGSLALMRALVQVNRAIALTHLNDIDTALKLYETARDLYNSFAMEGEAAVVETDIAFLHHVSGWYAAALAHLNRAYPVFIAQGRTHDAARCDIDRGEAYRGLNLFPEALECYERALSDFTELPLEYDHARAALGKAAALFGLARTADALQSLEQAEALFRQLNNLLQLAHVQIIRASWLYDAGDSEASRSLAAQASLTFARRGLFGWAGEARFIVAKIDFAQGHDVARRMNAIRQIARQTNRGWLECRVEQVLGQAKQRRGRMAQALRHYRRGIAALESARTLVAPDEMHTAYLNDKLSIYAEIVTLLLDRGQPRDIEEALGYAERSRARLLLDRLSAVQEQIPNTSDAQKHLATLRGALARAQQADTIHEGSDPRRFIHRSSDPVAELEHAYTEALRAIQLDELIAPNTGVLREVITEQEKISLSCFQNALHEKETLLAFYALEDSFIAFLITRHDLTVVRLPICPGEVTKAARRLRYHLQKIQVDPKIKQDMFVLRQTLCAEIDGVLNRLYQFLLAPLEGYLDEGAQLTIIPFGELHALPFHAFHDGKQYATERWDIAYAPSVSVWYRLAQSHRGAAVEGAVAERAVLVSVPGPGIERVDSEVNIIRGTVPNAQVLLGDGATATRVVAASETASILHIAAHAQFRKDNPQFSGILLADGWFLARDVCDMKLSSTLVTLSACETAVSKIQSGDEMFGLIRAFLTAGARAVVGSFWPADDEATAELMVRFYEKRENGLSDSAALRLAQKEIRVQYPHPYHWAAFSLIGIGSARQKVYA